ncbi:RagB/SusD family nutrient uptake outer membrane protein [Sphingobacterium kitahiroshimense]|uniref:RagB/SusD family nutrient uptake outer membrane protein n=1 Tax=Sphingobacterium sp. B16(2022) TaxID=2914044 RepID=UPI001439A625|nr:RagB/SusD family nutrient uptake outer membrane protein [Sphingobacterium sp. B16(2022)]NJI76332.1 RagB/SusD family nutrient uptake outer membrane protein [Sphingobacterium sp. B16(2022)]
MSTKLIFMMMSFLSSIQISCNDFLEEKSDMSLATVNSKADLYALMDYTVSMNQGYVSAVGDIASDDFFIPDQYYRALNQLSDRSVYVWERVPLADWYWLSYGRILNVNIVLENIDKIQMNKVDRNNLMGIGLFFRAFSYFDLAQIYSKAYDDNDVILGPPVKSNSDVNDPPIRLPLKTTINSIVEDLKVAASSLPEQKLAYPTRPNRSAALGLLSRVYLAIGNFEKALLYADSTLSSYGKLMDFNLIKDVKKYPFERFNAEVLFFSIHSAENMSRESVLRIDTNLYESYDSNDLRKKLFFSLQNDGYYAFTGDYSGNSNAQKFNGITTAELWLNKAECHTRLGDLKSASDAIVFFRSNRYVKGMPLAPLPLDKEGLLTLIYAERRKELLLRGIRWMDLRRLEDKYINKKELTRKLDSKEFKIDLKEIKNFTFLIPQKVIELSNIKQN